MSKAQTITKYSGSKLFRFCLENLVIPCQYFCFYKVIEERLVLEYLSSIQNKVVVDIGCGCGELCLKLCKKGATAVVGIDLDRESLINARELSREYSLIMADAQTLPLKSHISDAICSLSCLEHVNNDDKAIEEMARIVKPDGSVVLTVDSIAYNESMFRDAAKKYRVIHRYHLQQFKRQLRRQGINVKKAQYFINSRASMILYKASLKNKWFNLIFFPFSLYAALISDTLMLGNDLGCELAIKATVDPR